MTKADIVDNVSDKTGFTKKDSIELVEQVFELMKDTLAGGENLKLSGFGNFIVRQKADRKGRNPQTGEGITIKARRVVAFNASVILKNDMNQESA